MDRLRRVALVAAVVLFVFCLVPPGSGWARRYEFAEALQFSVFAVVVPCLLVAGSPWRLLRLAGPALPSEESIRSAVGVRLRLADAVAVGRRRHREASRAFVVVGLYIGSVTFFRTPLAVNSLVRHAWLSPVEGVILAIVGVGLWLELIESPPLVPRSIRPLRMAMAAVSMWAIWIMAYLVGLSHSSWFHAFAHHVGTTISVSADQQLATGFVWFVSAAVFIPVVFWNLVRWLQSEDSPDDELHRLIREERLRGRMIERGSTAKN